MRVPFLDGTSPSEIDRLQDKLAAMPEVESVTFVTKRQALDEFESNHSEAVEQLEGVGPIPAYLRVILKPGVSEVERDGVVSAVERDPAFDCVDVWGNITPWEPSR